MVNNNDLPPKCDCVELTLSGSSTITNSSPTGLQGYIQLNELLVITSRHREYSFDHVLSFKYIAKDKKAED